MSALAVVLAVVSALLLAGPSAATRQAAHGPTRYTSKQVRSAFAAVGDPLVDLGYGALASPVTVLSTIRSRQGWTATVYVYPTVREAGSSFKGNLAGWRSSGIAAAQRGNLVVTVSGEQAAGSHTESAPTLPEPVSRALNLIGSRTA